MADGLGIGTEHCPPALIAHDSGAPRQVKGQHPVRPGNPLLHQGRARRRRQGLARHPFRQGQRQHAGQGLGGGMHIGRGDLHLAPLCRSASGGGRALVEEGRCLDGVDRSQIGRGGRLLHAGDAGVLGLGQAQPQVQPRRIGKVGLQRLPHRSAVGAAEHFAREITDRDRVIARGRAWFPQRGLTAQDLQHLFRLEPQGGVDGRRRSCKAGLMAHQLGQGDVRLARLTELGPDRRDRCLIVQKAALDRPANHQRHDRLAGREHGGEGVRPERLVADAVGLPAPQVQYHLARATDGEARADLVQPLGAVGEVAGEGVPDRGEAVGTGAVDLGGVGHSASLTGPAPAIQSSAASAATTPDAITACSR